jgi:NADH-quinone oxidoreductase subunit L
MDAISTLLVMIPALPLLSAVLTALLGPRILRQHSHWLTIAALAGAFVCSAVLVRQVNLQHAAVDGDAFQLQRQGETPQVSFERVVNLWTWANVDDAYQQAKTPPGNSPLSSGEGGMRDLRIDIALRADGLTSMMLAMVTFVATLVAIFAAGYMRGDRSYWRFFAFVSLFVFSMTMLVSVSNFVLLYVFWEAVGVCSYLLIGFWYEKPEAAAAGKKAFLVNRIGDFGFALALFLIWTTYGTLNFHDTVQSNAAPSNAAASNADTTVAADAGASNSATTPTTVRGVLGPSRIQARDYVGGGVGLAICLLLMLGACGKSAQFPLHVWLPDAMEGPTPVSALIHAATMVTAGVYMVARCTPLFMASPTAQLVVACIGAFTALLAGLIALSQFDLKRVLAYSTVSQLGLMFLGLGAGTFAGITAGMFHLFTHAFFKALLFLGAGSVMHAMGHIIDMRRFSGLRRVLPTTHMTFLIGCLALAGVPPFAGFWSKDAVLAAVEEKAHGLSHEEHQQTNSGHAAIDHSVAPKVATATHADVTSADAMPAAQRRLFAKAYQFLYYVGMVIAFLTAFYTFRAFYLTFYGEERIPYEAGDHAHESPAIMCAPLVVLAVCAGVVGFILDQTYAAESQHLFASFIGYTPSLAVGAVAETRRPFQFHLYVAGVSTFVALAGWLTSTYFYLGDRREIVWLRSVAELERPAKWLDVESVSRLKNLPWIAGIHRAAQSVHLGSVTATIGYLLQFVVLIVGSPILLARFISPYKLSYGKFFFDEIYQLVVVLPLRFLADACYVVDRWIIDGFINTVGRLPVAAGSMMRSLQMGLVPFYALSMLLGALVLFAARLLWG